MNELESRVLQMLLAGDHPVLATLRRQLAVSSISRREQTGVGFYVEMAVGDADPLPDMRSLRFGDVMASIQGLEHGAGFLLYVDGGFLHMLEGYSYGEAWPETADVFSLQYEEPERGSVLSMLGSFDGEA